MPVQKIGDVIANLSHLQALAIKANRLKELQLRLFEASPPTLAAASRVADLRSGTLIVVSDNAAVAAKLRQLVPRLLLHVREQATEVTGIRVEVQVKGHKIAHKIKDKDEVTARALPPDAVEDFANLSARLPAASPLKSAVERLVARRTKRPR